MVYKKSFKKSKARVLSNKQLTRKVRAISGTEGARNTVSSSTFLYDNATLVAGTAQMVYIQTVLGNNLFHTTNPRIHHYYDARIKLLTTSAGGATVRLIYGFDDEGRLDGAVAEVLQVPSNSCSPLISSGAVSYKELRYKKNLLVDDRFNIVRDQIIPLVANEPKCMTIRLPLFNKKTRENSGGANLSGFQPFVLMLSDEANATVTWSMNYCSTDLEN